MTMEEIHEGKLSVSIPEEDDYMHANITYLNGHGIWLCT